MKKLLSVLGVLLIAALAALPAPARGEVYVEAYLGGVFGANAGATLTASGTHPDPVVKNTASFDIPGRLDPAFQGGLKLGTWFVKEGFLGFNYPAWMKYFGFYLDFSMHRLDFRNQLGTYRETATAGDTSFSVSFFNSNFSSHGYAPTLAFMFAARYGFYPDATCPFGRLQPYLAVGPAIMFASQDPAFTSGTNTTSRFIDGATPLGAVAVISPPNHRSFSSSSDATICLAAEAGLRWMALKNVSLDVSFKYRYAQPTFSGTYTSLISAFSTGLLARATDSYTFSPTFHLFSFQVGAAYHF